jgi:succinoglycan biosynthesis protein ExoA
MSDPMFISIIVPTLNEEKYIEAAISELMLEGNDFEIIVVDGNSTDRTPEIVADIAGRNNKVRLLQNPKKIQAAAINIGAKNCDPRATVFVQADAHCSYPKEFSRKICESMVRVDATSCVVHMDTKAKDNEYQQAFALAQNSRLGNGGSAHRIGSASRWIDHGHHAAFDLAFFLENGGYDENFPINHDGEYDVRTASAGAKVWLDGDLSITHFPRTSFEALAKQYYRYGKGRANTVWKHRIVPKARQLAPAVITLSVAGSLLLSLSDSGFFVIPLAYAGLCGAYGVTLTKPDDDLTFKSRVALAFPTMHLSWGTGFILEISRKIVGTYLAKVRSDV